MFSFIDKLLGRNKKTEENGYDDQGANARRLQKVPVLTANESISIQTDEEFPRVINGKIESTNKEKVTIKISETGTDAADILKADTNVQVAIRHDGETIQFKTKVMKFDDSRENPLLTIKYPDQIIQEEAYRKNVRVPSNIPSRIALEGSEDLWNMVHISDISLSGLSIYSSKPYRKGDTVIVKIISMQYPLELKGEVVRSVILVEHAALSQDKPDYNLGIKLKETGDLQQQMLAEFIVILQKRSAEFHKQL
jgi:hypothetical protein